ncbi:type VI secretion system protein TssA [Pseudomonas sp. NPDC089734]|uniref:type VI secretion system protein TssA n=1 Tax=Pseudomonas sp. NPDC089734 TaxID=3364469 RepID=UPI00381BD4A2
MSQLASRVSALLEPLSAESPCGVNLRHDPVYDHLRQLRREDDASLPMGVWQSDIKRADWHRMEVVATTVLHDRSKDLMVAVWLGEAWLHIDARAGIKDALSLVAGLCERYPEDLYPQPADGDLSWRATPIEWMVRRYSELLQTHFPLLEDTEGEFSGFGLSSWHSLQRRRVQVNDSKAAKAAAEEANGQHARLNERVRATPPSWWLSSFEAIQTALQRLAGLEAWSAHYFHEQEPSYGTLRQALESSATLFKEFIAMHPPQALPQEAEEVTSDMTQNTQAESGHEATPARVFGEPKNREEAYRQLLLISDYLARTEPHSPVPYLIRKGVEWGNKPLKELLSELISSDAEARRVWTLLGVL